MRIRLRVVALAGSSTEDTLGVFSKRGASRVKPCASLADAEAAEDLAKQVVNGRLAHYRAQLVVRGS